MININMNTSQLSR